MSFFRVKYDVKFGHFCNVQYLSALFSKKIRKRCDEPVGDVCPSVQYCKGSVCVCATLDRNRKITSSPQHDHISWGNRVCVSVSVNMDLICVFNLSTDRRAFIHLFASSSFIWCFLVPVTLNQDQMHWYLSVLEKHRELCYWLQFATTGQRVNMCKRNLIGRWRGVAAVRSG